MSETGPFDELVGAEDFARAAGIDPDNVPVLHAHVNPETGQVATASWPCPQCFALGRTEPLRHGRDVPDEGGLSMTEIPPGRLDAYLGSFGSPPETSAASADAGGHRARRKARRQAERKARRRRG